MAKFVYVVLRGEEHQGGSVVGVFATREGAVKCALGQRTYYEGGWVEKYDTLWVNGCDFVEVKGCEIRE